MTDDPHNIERQLYDMQQRLARIERKLGLTGDISRDAPPTESIKPADVVVKKPAVQTPGPVPAPVVDATPKPLPPISTPPVKPPPAKLPPPPIALPRVPPNAPATSASFTPVPATSSTKPPKVIPHHKSLELVIAAKWFAWIGAIFIVLGAAFALREFGTDLWTRLAPTAKCLIIAAFGGALIVTGEFVLRRINRLAAVGLFSAGLGVLYLDAYATFHYFNPPLVTENWSFALMAVVALAGFGITLRTKFKTIGVLSLLAGYATPILLSSGGGNTLELLTFLTVLLGIALALSAALPRQYRTLRYLALGLHLFVAGLWMLGNGQSHWLFALIFMSIWWAMLLAECTFAAVRRQSSLGNCAAVLLATASYISAGTIILSAAIPAGVDWLGLYTAGIAIISAVTALQFGPGLEALRKPPKIAIDKLAVTLWAQAGVLLIVAAALQFDGYGRTVAWLMMGAVSIELGNRLRSRGLDVFGMIVGTLAIAMVITIDAFLSPVLSTEIWSLHTARFDIIIDRWSLLCLSAIIVTMYAALRLRTSAQDGWLPIPIIMASVATIYWIGLCVARCEDLATTAGWMLGAALLVGINLINRKLRADAIAIGVLLLGAAWWIGGNVLAYRGSWANTWPGIDALPFINSQFIIGVLLSVMFMVVYIITARRIWPNSAIALTTPRMQLPLRLLSMTTMLPVAAAVVLTVGSAMEIERILSQIQRAMESPLAWPEVLWRLLWITMFISIASSMMMAVGYRRRLRPLLDLGLLLMLANTLVWLSFETFTSIVTDGFADVTPIFNAQFFAGLSCALSLLFARRLLHAHSQTSGDVTFYSDFNAAINAALTVAATLIIVISGAIELERSLSHVLWNLDTPMAWPELLWRVLWLTMYTASAGAVIMLLACYRRNRPLLITGIALAITSALAWLSYETLVHLMIDGLAEVMPVLNIQFGAGLACAIALLIAWRVLRSFAHTSDELYETALQRSNRHSEVLAINLVGLIGLWLGSFEITRAFQPDRMAMQMGLSVYWGVYAVALVVLGFIRSVPMARYLGLALLGITAVKVLTIDLATVEKIWRIISMMVTGLLAIGVSIGYARLAPTLDSVHKKTGH